MGGLAPCRPMEAVPGRKGSPCPPPVLWNSSAASAGSLGWSHIAKATPSYATDPSVRPLLAPSFSQTSPHPSNSPQVPSTPGIPVSPTTMQQLCIWINSCKCVVDQPRKYLLPTFMLATSNKMENNYCFTLGYGVNTNATFLYEMTLMTHEVLIQHTTAFHEEK